MLIITSSGTNSLFFVFFQIGLYNFSETRWPFSKNMSYFPFVVRSFIPAYLYKKAERLKEGFWRQDDLAYYRVECALHIYGRGPGVVVSTTAFRVRVPGSFPGLGGLKETKMFFLHPLVKLSIVGSLRDREVACSASDLQDLYFASCIWRAVSSHHLQEVLLAQFLDNHVKNKRYVTQIQNGR